MPALATHTPMDNPADRSQDTLTGGPSTPAELQEILVAIDDRLETASGARRRYLERSRRRFLAELADAMRALDTGRRC